MKKPSKFDSLFIEEDGIVQSYSTHVASVFICILIAYFIGQTLGLGTILYAALVALVIGKITYDADVRVNGSDDSKSK